VHVRIADFPRHHCWSQFAKQANLTNLNVERGLVFDTAVLAVQYALSGEGIALVDSYLFGDYVSTGKLVKPFDVSLDDGYGYYLTTHPEALSDTAVALFRSWLIERFGTNSNKVVVIGGGVVGASVFYHLTKAGWKDVMLIERAELTSGSTWHAAGGMHTLNGDPNVAKLQQYTIELYKEIEAISGQSCGMHITGGLNLAGTRSGSTG
jgi:hypothetical protein